MLVLAPMAGLTDSAFRVLVREFGCDWVVSEMVSAKGLVYENTATERLLRMVDSERPLSVQIFGSDPPIMADAAQRLAYSYSPDALDINMGCPTPKIVRNGDGAALLRDPLQAAAVASAVVNAVSLPVTVKIRAGWDSQNINCVEVARRLEDAGVRAVTVHGRTREQFYSGQANWEWIRSVVESVAIDVIGNGDVFRPEDAVSMLAATGCRHIMIGRGAMGNPWLFRDINALMSGEPVPPPPTLAERRHAALRHLREKINLVGEPWGVVQMRGHLGAYLKGLPHAAAFRNRLTQCESYGEVVQVFDDLACPSNESCS